MSRARRAIPTTFGPLEDQRWGFAKPEARRYGPASAGPEGERDSAGEADLIRVENDDLRWPHRDGLIWPHFASVVVGLDVA